MKCVQPVRPVLVRICTAKSATIRRFIAFIFRLRTPYRSYGLFEVRTRFFQMRTEQLSRRSRFPSESPLHFAGRRDESVIVGYYTLALRPQARFGVQPPQAALSTEMKCISVPRHLPPNPERRDALWQETMASTAQASEISPFRTRLLATPSSTTSARRTAIETPTFFLTAPNGTSISRTPPPATPTCSPRWKPMALFPPVV